MRGTRKDYVRPTRVEVMNLIQAFFDAPQRESKRGGFAEVLEGDKDELDALILALVKYRYEPDSDGDRPIRWSLCDWTREEPGHYVNLPRLEDDCSNGSKVLDRALLNLAHANEAVQQVHRMMKFREEG